MKLSHKLVMVSAAALMSVTPLLGTAENVNTVQAAPKKTTSKKAASNKITLVRNAYVYDKNGKRLDKYMGSAKYTTIAKGVTVTTNGTKTIDGVKYYSLGNNAYIKAVNVDGKPSSSTTSLSKGTKAKFVSNSYIYDKNGKRINKYQGKTKFLKGDSVTTYGIQTIKGKKYYQLDKKGIAFVRTVNIDGKATANKKPAVSDDTEATNDYNYTLKSNAYVYDKNGKRINKYQGKAKLLKDASIDVYGIETIKGKKYYQLDKKGTAFVKAGNVSRTTKATSITMKKNAYIYNENGDTKKKTVKKGKTVKTTEARYIGTKLYYKIGDNQFVKAANVGKISGPALEPVNEPDGAATVDPGNNTVDPNVTKVTTINVAPLYNIKGQPDNVRAFGAGQSQQVSELRYIATSATATPELFYKLSSGRGYLKASDVAVSGKILTPVNTPEQARADVTVATAADKTKLLQDINEATSVKNSEAYKFASSDAKAAYDKAITDGTAVNNDATATIAQVNEADAAIVSAKAKLNGKKITVSNISNLTPAEVTSIVQLVATANNVPESSIQLSNSGALTIVTNGYTQVLNLSDYVTQTSATSTN